MLGALLAETVQLLWPARCAGCDDYVTDDQLFCVACARSVTELHGSCPGCALAFTALDAQHGRCRLCRQVPFVFSEAAVAGEYGGSLARAIVTMKHRGRRDLARRLARLLVDPFARTLAGGAFGPGDAIVPVPLHPRKLRRRGFNQALELAREARRALARQALRNGPRDALQDALQEDRTVAARLPVLERRLLRRTRDTGELGHLGPAARLHQVAGAFAVGDAARVRGRRVLLVDDVFTTGATLNECAGVLRVSGAVEVRVVALARAV